MRGIINLLTIFAGLKVPAPLRLITRQAPIFEGKRPHLGDLGASACLH